MVPAVTAGTLDRVLLLINNKPTHAFIVKCASRKFLALLKLLHVYKNNTYDQPNALISQRTTAQCMNNNDRNKNMVLY